MQITELKVKQTDTGYYLTAISKGVKYGQAYKDLSEAEAVRQFIGLIKTYEVKGDLYVMRNGSAY